MKQTYNEAQLAQIAKKAFKRLGVNKLYLTADGSPFILENRARLHAGTKGNVFTFENSAIEQSGDDPISAKEIKAEINNTEDLQEITDCLMVEVAGPNRPEVVEMIQARIDKLTETDRQIAAEKKEREDTIAELTNQGVEFDAEASTDGLKALLAGYKAVKTQESANSGMGTEPALSLDLSGNSKNTISLVNACTDVAVLNATAAKENAGGKRKGVLDAIAARITVLAQ